MNLIVDIGNTRAKVARAADGRIKEMHIMGHDLKGIEAVAHGCDAAIVSSVSERVGVELDMPCMTLLPDTPLPIAVEYGSRHTLGADRVAAAVGAWKTCPDRPCLVIDSGTCITIDLVLPGRGFVGGNISAGIDMRLRACHEFTGRLPLVAAGEAAETGPRTLFGTTTEEALRQGAWMGVRHEMEGYLRALLPKYGNLAVFMTGGASFRFDVTEKVPTFVRPYLVAEGLDAILEYNKSKKCN